MSSNKEETIQLESRKAQHVKLVVEEEVGVDNVTNGFELFEVVPKSIPNTDYHKISLTTSFLSHSFTAPVLVAGMTGGYPEAQKINLSLARVCSKLGIPMGVGSQRAMVVNHDMIPTYDVKKEVPDVFLIGNLGLVQFSENFTLDDYFFAQEKIDADAMALHVNAFQELCQPEGDVNFTGAWDWLEKICQNSSVPVVGKEVGSGIGWEEVKKMQEIGCAAVDVGGSGGTSWAKIEIMRHEGDDPPFSLDDPTLRWGIPTSFATWEATEKTTIPIISTGGISHGLMAAKALAMGANMVGIARPVLKALMNGGEKEAETWLVYFIETIKRVMFLMGVSNIKDLRKQKDMLIPTGRAFQWLTRRKFI
ncbi:MAG: type 2 isopentenyl-diphosphate Delta-isomerase [Candidatus Heimdallarchaeota archaeon]|nr:type 2 isopentenyl-diphosphate Delta-isomerase [Candidatus Heimdallarchaeota archaeon]